MTAPVTAPSPDLDGLRDIRARDWHSCGCVTGWDFTTDKSVALARCADHAPSDLEWQRRWTAIRKAAGRDGAE